jgi:predicted aldo/keto reductase-like oxidoreductase
MACRLLSIARGAELVGLSPCAMRREIASGDGPPTVRVGQRTRDANKLIRMAFERGVTFFDTAEAYGSP